MTDLERELIAVSQAWMAAIAANESDAIASYMTDSWLLVTPQAGPVPKADFLAAITSGRLVHHAMSSGDERVQVYDDCAVLVSRVQNEGAFLGEPFAYDEWSTDTYVRTDGAWRCAITALTPVDGPA